MAVKDDLKDYLKQARSLIYTYGDMWMRGDRECEGELAYWLMYADDRYDPTKGAKEGTWRVYIARCRLGAMRRKRHKKLRATCFTDIGDTFSETVANKSNYEPVSRNEIPVEDITKRCKLSKGQSQVLELLLTGLSQREIAEQLGVSRQAISCRYRLALQKLQSSIKKGAHSSARSTAAH